MELITGDGEPRTWGNIELGENVSTGVPWIKGMPDGKMPHPFAAMGGRIKRRKVEGKSAACPVFSAVVPIGTIGAQGGDEHQVVIAWKHPNHGRLMKMAVPMSSLFSKRKLEGLSAHAVPAASHSVGDLCEFIVRYMDVNQLPHLEMVNQLGWQAGGAMMVGRRMVTTEGVMTCDPGDPSTWPAVGRAGLAADMSGVELGFDDAGTFEGWLAGTLDIIKREPMAATFVIASCASVLLCKVDQPGCVLDLADKTGSGKTTIEKLAKSVWGDPSQLYKWSLSIAAAEDIMFKQNHLPLFLDDTKHAASEPGRISNTIYMAADGTGRAKATRGGTLRSRKRWHLLVMSTGEQSAVDYSKDGGAKTRCVTFETPPFKAMDGAQLGELNRAMQAHHGQLGVLFAQAVMRRGDDACRARFSEILEAALARTDNHQTARTAGYYAALTLAWEILRDDVGLPLLTNPVDKVWHLTQDRVEDAAGDVDAAEQFKAWAAASLGNVQPSNYDRDDRAPHGGWIGFRSPSGIIGFRPDAVRAQLKTWGFNDPAAILREWRVNGVTECAESRVFKQVRTRDARLWLVVPTAAFWGGEYPTRVG